MCIKTLKFMAHNDETLILPYLRLLAESEMADMDVGMPDFVRSNLGIILFDNRIPFAKHLMKSEIHRSESCFRSYHKI